MYFESKRQLVPAGVVQSVLAEIYDLGEVETPWGIKHKVRFIYEIPSELRNGTEQPMTVAQDFNVAWNTKSGLYKHIQSSLGRPFTPEEQRKFDPQSLIGINNLLTIQHNSSGDKVYANIVGVMPLMGTMKPLEISPYYTPYAEVLAQREEREAASAAASGSDTSYKV